MASTLGEVRSLALRESDELRKGFEGLEKFLHGPSLSGGRVAEVLVWFEDHLPVRVVENNCEAPQRFRPDRSGQSRRGENARSILRKLHERHGNQELSESHGRHPSEASAKFTAHCNHVGQFDGLLRRQKLWMRVAEGP